jgi:RNA polymerase sigma-70 factor (ECF subfamily)
LNSHSAGTAAQILVLSSKSEPTETHQTAEGLVADVTDETLLSLIKAGEKESLACLFRRYAPSVRSIGQRILHNAAEADDLVQDVFLYIYRKCALYNPFKGSARGWLIQVAYTQAFMRRRKVNSGGFRSSEIRDSDRQSGPEEGNGADDDHPLETFFGWNGWKKVWDSLSECQQETLRLHFYEGCTFAEISEKLGQSYVSIRHHYYRALEKLRKHANDNGLNWP